MLCHNIITLHNIKSILNKEKITNTIRYKIFLEKFSYQLAKI